MNIVDLIIKKRDGGKLSKKEIEFFVNSVVDGTIEDYQISAMLMAILLMGMDDEETAQLTIAMADSGESFDLSGIKGIKVDKHSTGGVADTTTLILAPLVASLGLPVVKMSGRVLGFSGGTIDKLESIPGFITSISEKDAISQVNDKGIVLMGQTDNLTPADKKLYAMRDVTGTVDSIPLIAASIMSKKIAAGADCIVLDVKCGNGAFMKTYEDAKALAEKMVAIGKQVNRKIVAVISTMDQPLGMYIGNSLEVIEALEVLKGNVEGPLLEVAVTLGAYMLKLGGKCNSIDEGKIYLIENIKNGKGLDKFKELITAQNGNAEVIDDYSLLPTATEFEIVESYEEGYVYSMDTEMIGRASQLTGAGRKTKNDKIDYGAGIVMNVRIGDKIKIKDVLATVYSSDPEKCHGAVKLLSDAITIKKSKPKEKGFIIDIIE